MKKYSYIFLFILIQITGFAEIIPSTLIQNERQYADRLAIQKEAQTQLSRNTGVNRLNYLLSLKFRKEFDEVIAQQQYCSTETSLTELLSGKRKELPKAAEKQLKKDTHTLNHQILENEKLIREGRADQTSYIVDLRKANKQPLFIDDTKLAAVNTKLQQINKDVQSATGTSGVAFYVLLNMYFPDSGIALNGLTRDEYLKKYMTELYNRSKLTSNGILLNVESFLRAAPGNATSENTAAPSKYLLSYQPYVALGKNLTEKSIDELIATNITNLGSKPGFEFGVKGASPFENKEYRGTVLDNYVAAIDDVIKGKVTDKNFLQTETNAEYFAELKLPEDQRLKLLQIIKTQNIKPTVTDNLKDYAGAEPFLQRLFGNYYSQLSSNVTDNLTLTIVTTSDQSTNHGLSAIQMARELKPTANGLVLGLHFLEPSSTGGNIRLRFTAVYGDTYKDLIKTELHTIWSDIRLLDYSDNAQRISNQIFSKFNELLDVMNEALKKVRIPESWWNTTSFISFDPFLAGVINAILDDVVGIVQLIGLGTKAVASIQYYMFQAALYGYELYTNDAKRQQVLAEINSIIENWFPMLQAALVNTVTFFMNLEGDYKDKFFTDLTKESQLKLLEGLHNATTVKDLAIYFAPFVVMLQVDIIRIAGEGVAHLVSSGWDKIKSANGDELQYYTGYVAVQIVGCFFGVTEAIAVLRGVTTTAKIIEEATVAVKAISKTVIKKGDDLIIALKKLFAGLTAKVDDDAYRKALQKLGKKVNKSQLLSKLDELKAPHTKNWINRLDETSDAELLAKVDNMATTDPNKLAELEKLYENMAAPAQKKGMGDFTIKVDGKDVYYDKNGFPDFTPHSPGKNYAVESDGLVGRNPNPGPQNLHPDFDIANKELLKRYGEGNIDIRHASGSPILIKIDGKWEGPFTWHHHQDGKTLMPVLQSIHKASSHSGGADIIVKGLQGLFNSPF